jgi:hypothetical protein
MASKLEAALKPKRRKKKAKRKPSSTTSLTAAKAKMMLHEGSARGHKLTKKQRGFLGSVAGKGE